MASNIKPASARKLRLLVSTWCVKACVFDFDGTIINSYPSGCEKMAAAAALFNYAFSEHEAYVLLFFWGKPVSVLFEKVFPDVPQEHRDAMIAYFYSMDDRDRIELFPGAKEAIILLYNLGYVLTLLTSRELDTTLYLLERHGLRQYFTHIACRDTVKVPKPNKEAFDCTSEALAALGIGHHECAMFGDANDDHGVAVNNNLAVIVLFRTGPYSIPDHPELPEIHPDNFLNSIADLPAWVEARRKAA